MRDGSSSEILRWSRKRAIFSGVSGVENDEDRFYSLFYR